MTTRGRSGITLVELLVVLAILGGLVTLAAPTVRSRSGHLVPSPADATIAAARAEALATGRRVTLVVPGGARTVTALPDGRVLHERH